MWANSTIYWAIKVVRIPVTIVGLLTTFISGILAALPLIGLAWLTLTSLIWQLFFWPLIGLAWTWQRTHRLFHPPIVIAAFPLALLGDTFIKFLGAMSANPDDRLGWYTKQTICQSWPYIHLADDQGNSIIDHIQTDEGKSFPMAVISLCTCLTRRQLGWHESNPESSVEGAISNK